MSQRGKRKFNPKSRAPRGDNSRAAAPTLWRQPPPPPSCLGCGQPFHPPHSFCPLVHSAPGGICAPSSNHSFNLAPAMPQSNSSSLCQSQPPQQQYWRGFPGADSYLARGFRGTGFSTQGRSQGTGYYHPQVGVPGIATATPSTIPRTEENSRINTGGESICNSAEAVPERNKAECTDGQPDLLSGLFVGKVAKPSKRLSSFEAITRDQLVPDKPLPPITEGMMKEAPELLEELKITNAEEKNHADDNKSDQGVHGPDNDPQKVEPDQLRLPITERKMQEEPERSEELKITNTREENHADNNKSDQGDQEPDNDLQQASAMNLLMKKAT